MGRKLTDEESKNQTQQLLNLKLHQKISVSSNTYVMRVPGGFLYITILFANSKKIGVSSSFVPLPRDNF